MFKLFVVIAAVAVAAAQAGLLVPTVTSQDSNIYRSYGNIGQVSTSSKSISTPFSSVTKSDVRISNPGYTVASPIAATYATSPLNVGYAAPAIATGQLGVTYSVAPAVSHMTYSNGLGVQYSW